MKPERLAEIEAWAKERPLGTTTLELVSALREAQAANTALVNDQSHGLLAQSLEETKTQRDTLTATLERVRALLPAWEELLTRTPSKEAGELRACMSDLTYRAGFRPKRSRTTATANKHWQV